MLNDVCHVLSRLAANYDNGKRYADADRMDDILVRVASSGEFWLVNGTAEFADGDIGDVNHEGMVIDTIMEMHDINSMQMLDLENKSLEEHGNKDTLLKELGFTDAELNAVRGLTDAREYGLQHLGWTRVVGRSVQTQTLTANDLREIGNGSRDAYQEAAENMKYDIEVYATHTMYYNVPWDVIETGNPMQLLPYRNEF